MKKIDFNDLAARMEEACGDWEKSEGLSETGKEALMEKIVLLEKEKKVEKTKHFPKKKRYVLLLAATLILLMGVGVVGGRTRNSDSKDLERGTEVSIKVNNEEKESVLREEEALYQEIGETLGISPMRFGYLPEGMILDSYSVAETTGWAYINYVYDGKIISVQMTRQLDEGSSNVQWDGSARKLDNVFNEYGYEIEAYCTDEKNQNYGAKIIYANGYYSIFGHFSDENEFYSILRGIFFKNL